MSLIDILQIASAYGLGVFTLFAIGLYFVNQPEKFFHLLKFGANFLHRFFRGRKRRVVEASIVDKLNTALHSLQKELPTIINRSLRINWIDNDHEFSDLSEGEVILYIRDSPNQSRVVVNSTMYYLKCAVIHEARPYVDRPLLNAIDVTLAQRVLISDTKAYEYLQQAYVEPLLGDDREAKHYTLAGKLDQMGVLTRIVLLEFSALAQKFKDRLSDPKVRQETVKFAEFVHQVVNRNEVDVPLRFYGNQFKSTVALVAKPTQYATHGSRLYQRNFRRDIENGTRIIHLLARGNDNVSLARNLTSWGRRREFISRVLPRVYYEPSPSGQPVLTACISCFSARSHTSLELNPVDETYSALSEIVPEVLTGEVQIVALERELGVRTKIVVRALDGSNPVPFFIGTNGINVEKLKSILSAEGEEFDFILWSPVPKELVARALYPLREDEVGEITIDVEQASATVVVTCQDVMGAAIGKGGINVRLAQRVTGYSIDITCAEERETPHEEALRIISENIEPIQKGDVKIKDLVRHEVIIKAFVVSSRVANPAKVCEQIESQRRIGKQLNREKIDFIEWDETIRNRIINALSPLNPTEVTNVEINEQIKRATIFVLSTQTLKEAVGRKGMNVKAADGYSIQIIVADA